MTGDTEHSSDVRRLRVRSWRWPAACFLLVCQAALAGEPGAPAGGPERAAHEAWDSEPFSFWSIDVDAGWMWRVNRSTHINYEIATSVVSLRTPAHIHLRLGEGDFVVRARFSLLGEGFAQGAEDYYFGFTLSPSLEYWWPDRKKQLFFSIGGGAGWTNSQGVRGGQGQDFTLNWFMHGGFRYRWDNGLSLGFGAYYQHLSNGGATDPNPGLNTAGPMLGLSWEF